ncbi:MAG: N-acetyltransferase [Novosphingobium sp.]|nr:N-acetyltransferase [Novosphingobium sp.]
MTAGIAIRDERPGDAAAITRVIAAAFADHPHSDGSEPRIVEQLRRNGDLTLSLVAETADGIVGHIAFSPVTIERADSIWFGLGPVSVPPACQNSGIGAALVRAGLSRIGNEGATGCVLLGEPDYYRRFGFSADTALVFPGAPDGYFMALAFSETASPAEGIVRYAPAFYSD